MLETAAPPPDTHTPSNPTVVVDVVLCAGQSNMRGHGQLEDLPGVLVGPHSTARLFHQIQLEALLPGTGKHENGFGPELSFGHTLAAQSERPIVLVKTAKGGTSLAEDWNPDAAEGRLLYAQLLEATRQACDQITSEGQTPNLRGFFWYQGESDCENAELANAYANRLAALITRLRTDLNTPTLPGVLVRVNPRWASLMAHRFPVRQAIESVANQDEHLAWIDIDDLYLPDDLHVDGPGLLTIGDRAAQSLLALPTCDFLYSIAENTMTHTQPPEPPEVQQSNVSEPRATNKVAATTPPESSQPTQPPTTPEPDPSNAPSNTAPSTAEDTQPEPIENRKSKIEASLPRPKETRVIALINQKGGVGKTTTTVNLGAALAERGQRVLLVDLDPQAHLTLSIGVNPEDCDLTIYDLLSDDNVTALEVCREISKDLAILPADVSLAGIESELAPKVVTGAAQTILKTKCEALYQAFDYVLIDCPPALGLLTINGLTLAKEVIVPMQAHFLALQGLGKLLETVQMLAQGMNPTLTVAGIALCMHEANTVLAGEVVGEVQGFLDEARGTPLPWRDAVVFAPPIRRNIKLAEAPSFGQSVFAYAPESNGATDYAKLAASVAIQTN